MTSEITPQAKHECLEHRVDFMVRFYLAMREWGIPESYLNLFEHKDVQFIEDFCYHIKHDPEPYVVMYRQKITGLEVVR